MSEEWVKWVPLDGIPAKMYIEKLVADKNGTLLEFKGENDTIRILFRDLILSLRSTDEGRRLKTINFLDEKYGKDFYSKWTLFKVVKSNYVEWFNKESYNMYSSYNIEHFVFMTPDDIVEILSTYEPEINKV